MSEDQEICSHCSRELKDRVTPQKVISEIILQMDEYIVTIENEIAGAIDSLEDTTMRRDCLMKVLDQVKGRPKIFEDHNGHTCY